MPHYDAFDKANKIAHDSLEFYRQAVKRSEAEEEKRREQERLKDAPQQTVTPEEGSHEAP